MQTLHLAGLDAERVGGWVVVVGGGVGKGALARGADGGVL